MNAIYEYIHRILQNIFIFLYIFFFRVEMKDIFNPYFGSVFRSKKNPTFFSRRLFRVADVYTSRVTNFHNYSLGVSEYFLHGKRNQKCIMFLKFIYIF